LTANELDIEVRDTVLDPNLPPSAVRKIHFRKEGEDTYYYKVWLYLAGRDLPYVESVTYTLDETFPNPNRTVRRTPSNPNCQLVIWTWGLFTVKATIVDKKGFSYEVMHELSYDKELTSDHLYEEEEESSSSNRPRLVTAS
jgi:transcription initiation factor IIF auxiliary subunit